MFLLYLQRYTHGNLSMWVEMYTADSGQKSLTRRWAAWTAAAWSPPSCLSFLFPSSASITGSAWRVPPPSCSLFCAQAPHCRCQMTLPRSWIYSFRKLLPCAKPVLDMKNNCEPLLGE